jgi:FixJ family two-component response regulator
VVDGDMGTGTDTIYIVDDDPAVREALSSLFRASGKEVHLFASGAGFLSFERDDTPTCLVLDLEMPGMNGLDVQRFVAEALPIIFISRRGDVASTVKAMKGGASDLLPKPVDEARLLAAVERALDEHRIARRDALHHADLLARYRALTPREQEVLRLLANGRLNKQIAAELGITDYTVQKHRGNIMRKMKAESFASLVRITEMLKPEPARTASRQAMGAPN